MTITDLTDRLGVANDILDRALRIIASKAYNMYCSEEQYARVEIFGDQAQVTWPEIQSGYYNSSSIEQQSASFPAELLLMSDLELDTWIEEQKIIAERKAKADLERGRRQRAAAKQEEGLRTLAELKKKYES